LVLAQLLRHQGDYFTLNLFNMPERSVTSIGANESAFDVLVDKVLYSIKAKPFLFNDETRFYVSINNGPDHIFVWDQQLIRFRAIDDSAAILPDALEEAISEKLYQLRKV
jgi:hypothetical protein